MLMVFLFCEDLEMEKLSVKELEVLKEVIIGLNNRQIAKKLYLAVGTVKAYLSSIMRKLDASNRTSLVYIAVKNKIIEI